MTTPADEPLSYWVSLARLGFEEDVDRLLTAKELNRTKLAGRMEVTLQDVSKLLRGSNNYRLTTLAKIARALDAILEVRLTSEDSEVVRVMSFDEARAFDDQKATRKVAKPGVGDGIANVRDFPGFKHRDPEGAHTSEPATAIRRAR